MAHVAYHVKWLVDERRTTEAGATREYTGHLTNDQCQCLFEYLLGVTILPFVKIDERLLTFILVRLGPHGIRDTCGAQSWGERELDTAAAADRA